METFETLLTRFNQLKDTIEDLIRTKASGYRAKAKSCLNLSEVIKGRMDKYGCRDKCYEFQIRCAPQAGHDMIFRMILINLTDAEITNPKSLQKIIQYRVYKQYGTKYRVTQIHQIKEVKLGTCLPA